MKSKLKGFTLVELIVVMVIMSLIMAGIMQIFKPIRTIYVDSTQYEAQRTAQNGVVQYITESVRFATDMGVYNDVSNASDAVDEFAAAYCAANNIDSAKVADVTKAIKKNAEVIIIDNKTTHYSKNYTGRVIRRKVDGTSSTVGAPSFSGTNKIVVPSASNLWRTALGEAYYGENTYYITFDVSGSANGRFDVNVISTRNGKRDISALQLVDTDGDGIKDTQQRDVITGNITRGGVFCRNLVTNVIDPDSKGARGVVNPGIYDVNYSANNSKDAYIVFLNIGEENKAVTPHTFTGKKAVEQAAK